MNKSKTGIILIVCAVLTWMSDRSSLAISTYIGELYCGEQYMQTVNGVVGDQSCGFNSDSALVVILLFLMLIGIVAIVQTYLTTSP